MEQDKQAPTPALPAEIPALPADATAEQRDAHWFKYVYQGDRMPQLTVRSVLVGGMLGMMLSASNLYTTLSIGWAFGVTITACVMSYVLWNLLRLLSGNAFSSMSILESNCMASTASAAGYSTGGTLATMFGALLLMEVAPPGKDGSAIQTLAVQKWWLVGSFTFLTGLMGVFLAIPMKRQMINHERLPFPSGIATAETLKALYSHGVEAMRKAYAMLIGIGTGIVVGFLRTSEGMIEQIDHLFAWVQKHLFSIRLPELIPSAGLFKLNGKSLIGFGFEPSMMIIGAGMIVGLRVSISMLAGSALLYFVVSPVLIHLDTANAGQAGYVQSIETVAGGTIYHVYRWGLWGGTAVRVFSSMTGLALQWRTIVRAFAGARKAPGHGFPVITGLSAGRAVDKEGPPAAPALSEGDAVETSLNRIEVPGIWMVAGMIPITIGMLILQVMAFGIAWWAGLIAVGMSFILSVVACRATGETDTTPIGAMGKVMQLLFALIAPGNKVANLASAGIAANSAGSSADLLTDLKSGYLLGANPRKQFLAQFFGVFFGTLAIVPIWYLMVPTQAALERFPAPATQMWYKVAQVLTQGIGSLPYSARLALFIGAVVGIAIPLIERLFVPERFRKYYPSAMGIGLAWVVPFANAFSFFVGAVVGWVWKRASARSAESYTIPLASGLVAGESLYLAFIAITATIMNLVSGK